MKLSIVTVVYNNLNGLKLTSESILPLPKNVEWIIVDGASTDGTQKFVQALSSKNIRVLSEADSGIFNAMNKGIVLACGEYLIFMNSGDYFNRSEFLKFEQILEKNQSDIIVCNYIPVDSNNNIGFARKMTNLTSLCRYDNIPHQSTFIAQRVFDNIGGYDDKNYTYTSDYEFFLRAFKANHSFIYLENIYLSYFIQDGLSYKYNNALLIAKENRVIQKKYCLGYSIKLQVIYYVKYCLQFLSFIDPLLRRLVFRKRKY